QRGMRAQQTHRRWGQRQNGYEYDRESPDCRIATYDQALPKDRPQRHGIERSFDDVFELFAARKAKRRLYPNRTLTQIDLWNRQPRQKHSMTMRDQFRENYESPANGHNNCDRIDRSEFSIAVPNMRYISGQNANPDQS